MRELKFRAWVYYGEKLKKPHYSRDYESLSRFFEDHDENDIDQCIEQYTGLKDKNGKEIYEGDILGDIYEHGYIAYCDKCKQLQFFDADMGCMMCSGDIYWRDIVESERNGEFAGELEVVATIHKNPELLEDEE